MLAEKEFINWKPCTITTENKGEQEQEKPTPIHYHCGLKQTLLVQEQLR